MKVFDKTSVEALYKLAYFEPNHTDDYGNQILDYLFLDAISNYGRLLVCELSDIKRLIKDNFIINFENDEIIQSANRLKEKGYIEIIEPENRHEYPKFKLIEESEVTSQKKNQQIKDIEQEVFQKWKEELKEKYKSLLTSDKNIKLVSSFQSFITKLFVRHGIESVTTLYPNNDKSYEWLSSIQHDIIT